MEHQQQTSFLPFTSNIYKSYPPFFTGVNPENWKKKSIFDIFLMSFSSCQLLWSGPSFEYYFSWFGKYWSWTWWSLYVLSNSGYSTSIYLPHGLSGKGIYGMLYVIHHHPLVTRYAGELTGLAFFIAQGVCLLKTHASILLLGEVSE